MATLVLWDVSFQEKNFGARSETAQFQASIIVLDSVLVFHPHEESVYEFFCVCTCVHTKDGCPSGYLLWSYYISVLRQGY